MALAIELRASVAWRSFSGDHRRSPRASMSLFSSDFLSVAGSAPSSLAAMSTADLVAADLSISALSSLTATMLQLERCSSMATTLNRSNSSSLVKPTSLKACRISSISSWSGMPSTVRQPDLLM
jgi:hypothetical protein